MTTLQSNFNPDSDAVISNFGTVIENVIGTRFNDVITGNDAGNRLVGGDGDDKFILGRGNDDINGGNGIDTVVLPAPRGAYLATTPFAGGLLLSSAVNGTKSLTSIERVLFNGGTEGTAYDISGAAGDVIKLLGVTFGQANALNKDGVGIGLSLRDSGLTRDQVSEVAIKAAAGATASNAAVVNVLWNNLFGHAPTTAEAQPFINDLNAGAYTRGALVSAAANVLDGKVHLTGVASVDFNVF